MKTLTTAVTEIHVLQPGETPWEYSNNPGVLPGPWGATASEAIAEYERQTGAKVAEHWDRTEHGKGLWIITEAR